jgi:hypothetical protein
MNTPKDLEYLLGKTRVEAEKEVMATGHEFRVVSQEGKYLLVTADCHPTRINVRLSADGKVIGAHRG